MLLKTGHLRSCQRARMLHALVQTKAVAALSRSQYTKLEMYFTEEVLTQEDM
jgi:hypothetical protein